jgi:hypothetical protein
LKAISPIHLISTLFCLSCVFPASGAAQAGTADVLVRLKSSFFPDFAAVAPSAKLSDQFANLFLRAAWYCPSTNDINFLVILSRKAVSDVALLADSDCSKATAQISKEKHGDAFEVVARVAVKPPEAGAGVVLAVTEMSTFDGNTLSEDDLKRIRSASIKYEQIKVPIRINDSIEQIDIIPNCSSSDNLRPIRHFENGGSGSSGVRV